MSMMIITGGITIIAVLTAIWARVMLKAERIKRDEIKAINDALDAAGRRLEAARQANQKPIDPKQRANFERQP